MRISDCSSDVCSSDLFIEQIAYVINHAEDKVIFFDETFLPIIAGLDGLLTTAKAFVLMGCANLKASAKIQGLDRKSVVKGKSVSVRVDLGGRRLIKKKRQSTYNTS